MCECEVSYLDKPTKEVSGKQKKALLSNFTTQTCVKNFFDHG